MALPPGYTVEPETWETDDKKDDALSSGGGYVTGLASEFGRSDINNPTESHVGAWDNDITSPDVAGVALPATDLVKHFGSTKDAQGKMVEVKVGDKTGVFPIVDIGPGEGIIARQGPTIDLTFGAARQLGHSGGLDKAEYKILKPLAGDYKVEADPAAEQDGQAPGPLAGGPPPGAKPLSSEYKVTVDEGPAPLDVPDVNPELVSRVNDLQNQFGPIKINSGYRDPEHNRAVGGAKGSQHMHGNAVDIDVSNMSIEDRQRMINQASQSGITGIGVYNNALHFDLGPRRSWGPSHGSESVPEWAQPAIAQHLNREVKPLPASYKVEIEGSTTAETETTTGKPGATDYASGIGPVPTAGSAAEYRPGVGPGVAGGDVVYDKGGPRRPVPPEPPGKVYRWTEYPGKREPGAPTIRRRSEELPMVTEEMATKLGLTDWKDLESGREVRRAEFAGKGTGVSRADYEATQRAIGKKGLLEPGNIDLSNRPILHNADGTISSEKSFSIEDKGKEVLLPLIVNGKELTQEAAIEHYRKTGEHMGKFKDAASADAAAEIIHNRGQGPGETEGLAKRAERYPERLPEVTTEGLVKSEAPMANLVPSGARKFIQGKMIEPAEKWLLQHGPGTGYGTELAQRAAKEGPGGIIKAAKGIRTGQLSAGEQLQDYTENRYSRMQDPIAFAKADIPRLHQEIDAQRVKVASMRNRGYVSEGQETTYQYGIGDQASKVKKSIFQEEEKKLGELIRTLRQAEDAAEGRLGQETYSDKLLNAAGDQMVAEGKRSLPEINKKLEAWNEKWASHIDKKWDSDWGIQFVESAGANAGPILSSVIEPWFGGLMMYGQNVEANEKEITEKLKKAGKPINEQEVRKEAAGRAVDQTVMEYPGQIFMTKFLGKTIRNLPANWARQTAAVQGQWAKEAALEVLPELLQETLVTTPTQDLISRQRNEAMGISKPLTHEEAGRTTLASMGQAALQTLALGAAGATTTKVSEAAGEARAERAKAKIAAQPPPQTFTERQAQEKATLQPGTYRNLGDIPAEPTAVEKPGAAPTIPAEAPAPAAPTETIPTTPAAETFQKGQEVTYTAKDKSGETMSATVIRTLPTGQVRVETKLPEGGTTIADVDAPDLTPVGPIAAGPTIPPVAPAKPAPTILPAPPPKAEASVPAAAPTTAAPAGMTEEEWAVKQQEQTQAKVAGYEAQREGKTSQPIGTSAASVLSFEDERAPAPERAAQISALQSVLATHPRSGGKPVELIPVTRKMGGTKRQQALNRTIDGLEKALGKNIQFVRSGTAEALPFTGIVHPSHPDTIFLDAAGDRNVLALVGHEWGHTLKTTNPELHGQMVEQMKPLVREWAKQEGKLKKEEGYPEAEVSDEVASNTIGDAFTRPDFWKKLNKKNPSLFKKAVKSVHEFFKSLIKRARGSEWGTEEFINDLEQMHKVIAEAVNAAVTKGPEPKAAPKEAEGPKFAPRETKAGKPSLKVAMEGEKAEKLKEKMGGLRFAGRAEPVAPREFAVRKHGFYSKLEQTVIDKIPKSASPDQVKGTIAGAQLKAEEIKWSGVNQAIDRIASENGGKVPKDKLLQYLRNDGAVRLEEVEKRGQSTFQPTGEELGTRYQQYQLPSGENYREVVLAMPLPERKAQTRGEFIAQMSQKYGVPEKDAYSKMSPEEGAAFNALPTDRELTNRPLTRPGELREGALYRSTHFPDVPNYVAHARMNDRTDAEGKPGTFLEEIQSDRHQKGREQGYLKPREETEKELRAVRDQMQEIRAQTNEPKLWLYNNNEEYRNLADRENGLEFEREHPPGIPDAPFRKDWPVQMFKRALRDAVSEGKKWIGWTNGETQAERYDLSKQVDQITYSKQDNKLVAWGKDFDPEDDPIISQYAKPEDLPGIIGKEAADRLLNNPTNVTYPGGRFETNILKGVDLKIGGEGMKGFYDKMLPTEVGKYVKQWGAKVEKSETDIRRPEDEAWYEEPKPEHFVPIWKVEITPQMEKGVSEGQPLFATRKRQPPSKEAPKPEPEEPARKGRELPPQGPKITPFLHIGSPREALRKAGEQGWRHPIRALEDALSELLDINTDAFWESTQDTFRNMPGLEFLSAAMRKHVRVRAALAGKYGDMIHKTRMSVPAWHRKQADAEYGNYWRINQTKGRDAANRYYEGMSKGGKAFVDLSHKIYPELGRYAANMKEGLKIKNSETGRWEDFQEYKSNFKDYHPHRLQEKFMRALDDPEANVSAWNEMMDIMQGEGLTELQAKDKISAYKQADADNGFFGSLERKRVADLPSQLYDYSFAGLTDYVASFADRIAQVEGFGQGKGKDNTGTVWDEAINRAGNTATQDYIRDVMNQAYGQKAKGAAKIAMTTGTFLSGLHLGNPASAFQNLLSGEGMNMANMGVMRYFKTLPGAYFNIGKGYESGVLQRDFQNIMHDGEVGGTWAKKVSKHWTKPLLEGRIPVIQTAIPYLKETDPLLPLKATSQNAAESFVRGHSIGLAKLMLRDAIKAFEKNPRSRDSRRYLGYFKHLGFEGTEGQDLIAEGGEGPLFDRYLQEATVDVQAGYTYNRQTRLMNTPAGKIFGKYMPWGLEQLGRFQNRVMKPALRGVTGGRLHPETVDIINEDGEKETMKVPGEFMPLARYFVVLALAGGATEEGKEFLFGIPKRTATLAQILATFSKDQMLALNMAAEKAFMYLVTAGGMGAGGTVVQTGMDVVNRSRGKNPLSPPAFAFLEDSAYMLRDILDQGVSAEGTTRTVLEFAKRNSGLVRSGAGLANLPGRIDNAWSAPIPYLRKQAALQDANWLKSQTRRYDKEHGIKAPLIAERPTKTPTSALRENVYEDVLIGDSGAARERIREFKKDKPADVRAAIDEQVKDTIRSRHPIKAGGGSEAGRYDFKKWMKKQQADVPVLSKIPGGQFTGEADVARAERIADNYRKAARKVYPDLFPDETPKYKSLTDYMRKVDLAKKANRGETLAETVHYPENWPAAPEPFGSIVWQK